MNILEPLGDANHYFAYYSCITYIHTFCIYLLGSLYALLECIIKCVLEDNLGNLRIK